LVKEAAPLLTTALRKLTVCSSNLQKFVTLWSTTNANAFLSTKDPTTKQHQVLLSTNLLAWLQHFMLAKQIDAFSQD
jgi:hypothetical protein